jgi:hypothetical protein
MQRGIPAPRQAAPLASTVVGILPMAQLAREPPVAEYNTRKTASRSFFSQSAARQQTQVGRRTRERDERTSTPCTEPRRECFRPGPLGHRQRIRLAAWRDFMCQRGSKRRAKRSPSGDSCRIVRRSQSLLSYKSGAFRIATRETGGKMPHLPAVQVESVSIAINARRVLEIVGTQPAVLLPAPVPGVSSSRIECGGIVSTSVCGEAPAAVVEDLAPPCLSMGSTGRGTSARAHRRRISHRAGASRGSKLLDTFSRFIHPRHEGVIR